MMRGSDGSSSLSSSSGFVLLKYMYTTSTRLFEFVAGKMGQREDIAREKLESHP